MYPAGQLATGSELWAIEGSNETDGVVRLIGALDV